MLATIFILLVLFQIKHFVADYLLQNKWMLGKFKQDWSFALPLLAHSGTHGLFTLVICLIINPTLWWVSIIDIVVHFIIDRIKASSKYFGRFKVMSAKEMRFADWPDRKDAVKSNTYFWWALGLDQMVHHLTHYVFIFLLVK